MLPVAVSLIASAVPELLRLFKNDKAADVAEKVVGIAKEVAGTGDAEKAEEAIKADPAKVLEFRLAVLNQQADLEHLAFERDKLYVNDTQDARKYRDDKTFNLGVAVLITFAAVVGIVLYGCYQILRGGVPLEPGMFAAISGFIGTLVGYVAANAQQVIAYFFGSSKGSTDKTDAMADAIKRIKQ